jgi:hypothetical protein
MSQSAVPALPEITTLGDSAHANPPYPSDAPLIRVGSSAEPDPVIEAIARHVAESGSVFLELPGGRLTVVLNLDGKAWIAQRSDDGARG